MGGLTGVPCPHWPVPPAIHIPALAVHLAWQNQAGSEARRTLSAGDGWGGVGRSQQAVGPWNRDGSAGTHRGPSPSPCHQQPPYPSLSRRGTSNPGATLALFLLHAHIQPVRKFCLRFYSSDPEPAAAPASPPVPATLIRPPLCNALFLSLLA